MYLDSIILTQTLPCMAEPSKIVVVGKPSHPLDEVLPYLAVLPNVIAYNPDQRTLTFRRQAGFLTIYPDRVYITQVRDTEEGLELLRSLAEAINATWAHREKLVPVTARRATPRPLDVYAMLPQTNCKQCGEATCMAFAFALLQQRRTLVECVPLATDETFAGQRAAIEALI